MRDEPRELDEQSLRAIAHPLRFRILTLLSTEGASTATKLAERLGQSVSLTSYHLRQLALHEFIEEDAERGTGRERWWRPKHRGMTLRAFALERDNGAGTDEAMTVYFSEVARHQFLALQDYLSHRYRWPEPWREASTVNDFPLELTPERLRQLVEELREVVGRYQAQPSTGADAETVLLLLDAFPQRHAPPCDQT